MEFKIKGRSKKMVLVLGVIIAIIITFLVVYMSNNAKNKVNPAKYLITDEQRNSIKTITNINDGKLYVMDYTADYKLDDCLSANMTDTPSLMNFVKKSLLNGKGGNTAGTVDAGCSAFAAKTEEGDILYGRNFDYKMDMSAVLLRTTPKNGYASIGLVDTGWFGYGIGSLDDKKTDISLAVGFPYGIMDGMNEKGVAISVLKLDGDPTRQDYGNEKIVTSVALRLVLDRAGSVEEAISLLKGYDMQSAMPDANFHFLLSDSTGKTVVVEYTLNDMTVLDKCYASNYYLAPSMNGLGHGKDRYEIMQSVLEFKKGILSEGGAMMLLGAISQAESEESTSMTQWSVLYDLTKLNAVVSIRRDYEKLFYFSIDDISGKTK